jgi:hypothetical protein
MGYSEQKSEVLTMLTVSVLTPSKGTSISLSSVKTMFKSNSTTVLANITIHIED